MDDFHLGRRWEAPTPLGVILGELVAGIRERTMAKKAFIWRHKGGPKPPKSGPRSRADRKAKRGGMR